MPSLTADPSRLLERGLFTTLLGDPDAPSMTPHRP
jgi:hypothetical protein